MTKVVLSKHPVTYVDPDLDRYRKLVDTARQRYAYLSSELTSERRAIDVATATIYLALSNEYRRRDGLAVLVEFRKRYLYSLISEVAGAAETVKSEYKDSKRRSGEEYKGSLREAALRAALSDEEEAEIKSIWKRLARLYHPDHVQTDPERQQAFSQLLAAINTARANGDIALLREISENPESFIQKVGGVISLSNRDDTIDALMEVYLAVSAAIGDCHAALRELRASEEYWIITYTRNNPDGLAEVIRCQKERLHSEIISLEAESRRLMKMTEDMTGQTLEE